MRSKNYSIQSIELRFYSCLLFWVIIIFVFSLKTSNFAIQYPITPVLPDIPKVKGEESLEKSNVQPDKPSPDPVVTVEHSVLIELWGSMTFQGNISTPLNIQFVHHMNDFRFVKKVSLEEIQTIEILEFVIRDTKNYSNHVWYSFEPSKIKITLNDKTNFVLSSMFSFLNSVNINTKYGSTKLYSFFADTYEGSTWKDTKQKSKKYHHNHGHSRSIKKITFQN